MIEANELSTLNPQKTMTFFSSPVISRAYALDLPWVIIPDEEMITAGWPSICQALLSPGSTIKRTFFQEITDSHFRNSSPDRSSL